MTDSITNNSLDTQTLTGLLKTMVRVRQFEELIIEVYGKQDMKTPVHLCIGQEAITAGVCAHIRQQDYLFTTHRSHGHCLIKGIPPEKLYAEFYGRAAGCCKGKGGSMHPASKEHGVLGTSAIVGGGIPHAVGTGLASQLRNDDKLSVVFFGDGASEEGTFHESLNFSALKKLPVLFVCENNFYATTSPLRARQPNPDIHKRAQGYGIPSELVDGNDAHDVYLAAQRAVEHIRTKGGPYFIECRTYRWKGHVGPDCDYKNGCRPKEELFEWMDRCPIKKIRKRLGTHGPSEAEFEAMNAKEKECMQKALDYARGCEFPAPEDLYSHVFRES